MSDVDDQPLASEEATTCKCGTPLTGGRCQACDKKPPGNEPAAREDEHPWHNWSRFPLQSNLGPHGPITPYPGGHSAMGGIYI